jgi:hypothetical protein
MLLKGSGRRTGQSLLYVDASEADMLRDYVWYGAEADLDTSVVDVG